MKVEDIVKYRGPQLVPLPTDAAELGPIVPLLREAGYRYENVTRLFGNPWIAFNEMPGYTWRCEQEDSPLARMARLWLLFGDVPRDAVEAVLSIPGVRRLVDRGLLKKRNDALRAQVDLYECQGAYVFTDHNVSMVRFSKHVYEPGVDSYTCARTTPRRRVRRALDLCTGSGMHAILAAAHADSVVGVDVNARALAFARVNAAMNGVGERVRFLTGDLYGALPSDVEPFDLIVTNPPWIATPDDKMQLYRWGGETGEVLTRRIVEGLPRHLGVDGQLAMFVLYPVMRESTYLQRLREWLGDEERWGISLVTFNTMSLESFIASHLTGKWDWDEHVAEVGRWMDMYARNGIERMASGMVYVTRLPAGHAEWAVERHMPVPLKDLCAPTERWLDAVRAIHTEGWPQRPLRRSADVVHFGVDPLTATSRITFDPAWSDDVALNTDDTRALLAVQCGETDVPPRTLRRLALQRIIE